MAFYVLIGCSVVDYKTYSYDNYDNYYYRHNLEEY